MNKDNQKLIDFLVYSERLKTEYRHAHKSNGHPESVADHSWRLSLLTMIVAPKLKKSIDLLKALKLAIIHDLVEIEAKDVPILEHIGNIEKRRLKDIEEARAIQSIRLVLGGGKSEIADLWDEYLAQKTFEAKIVNVLDKIEGQTQFLSEDVKKFTQSEQASVKQLIALTADLCKVDPYLEQLYKDCGDLFAERTNPET